MCELAKQLAFSQTGQLIEEQENQFASKTRLYEALVLSTLLNSSELVPVSVTQMKKARCSTPQMATKYPGDFLKGQSNK